MKKDMQKIPNTKESEQFVMNFSHNAMTQWRQGGYESIASLATYLEPIYHYETITFNTIRIEVALYKKEPIRTTEKTETEFVSS